MTRCLSFLALAATMLVAIPTYAEESINENTSDEDEEPDLWPQSSTNGLSGFGEFISTDALPPMTLRIAVAFQYQELEISDRDSQLLGNVPTIRLEDRAHVFNMQVSMGIFLGLEIAVMFPVIDYELSTSIPGLRDQEFGFGNPEASVKWQLPLGMDMIRVAPYARVMFPFGERDLVRPRRLILEGGAGSRTTGTTLDTLRSRGGGEGEAGVAVGLHMDLFSIQVSIAGREVEGSSPDQTFKYRLGATLTPIPMLSLWAYADGEEFEGKTRSNVFFGAGVTLALGPAFVSLAGETLVVDEAYDDLVTVGSGDEARFGSVTLTVGAAF